MSEPGHNGVAGAQLRAGIERIERLHDENRAILDDIADVYGEYKGLGFDTKIMKRIVRERRKDAAQRDEEDTIFQLYWDAIHGGSDG